jgi:hypothetical protein
MDGSAKPWAARPPDPRPLASRADVGGETPLLEAVKARTAGFTNVRRPGAALGPPESPKDWNASLRRPGDSPAPGNPDSKFQRCRRPGRAEFGRPGRLMAGRRDSRLSGGTRPGRESQDRGKPERKQAWNDRVSGVRGPGSGKAGASDVRQVRPDAGKASFDRIVRDGKSPVAGSGPGLPDRPCPS